MGKSVEGSHRGGRTDWISLAALGAAYSAVFLVAESGVPETRAIAFVLAALLVWLSLSDLRQRIIPDLANLSIGLIGLVAWWEVRPMIFINALIALVVMSGLAAVSEHIWGRTDRDVLGLGDVKLIGAGVLVVGAETFWLMLLIASAGGIAAGLSDRALAREGIPFGPFLAYSIFLTFMLFGPYP